MKSLHQRKAAIRSRSWFSWGRAVCVVALQLGPLGCAAIYPELTTPVRSVPPGKPLDPPPPDDMLFLAFAGAKIPPQTQDGRSWDESGGSLPDPLAKLFVDDQELIRTPVEANTLTPTWPDQKSGNYTIAHSAKIRVELWDSNTINNHPICVKEIKDLYRNADLGKAEERCDTGGSFELIVEPPHAKIGLGMFYELRRVDVFVTRVLAQSPAERAGLGKGVQILEIAGRPVESMKENEARSLINSRAKSGLALKVKHPDGKIEDVQIKEGAIYPTIQAEVRE